MNSRIHILMTAAAMLAALPALPAADDAKPGPKHDKKEPRLLSREHQRRPLLARPGPGERETVAFLGVETGPVSAAVTTQLSLQRGTGLVVNHIVPESPAATVLEQHDILLKLDDQILIETRQLAVLIRNKKEGDEVTLTYLRGGKQATATVKLGKQEVPKFSVEFDLPAGIPAYSARRFEPFVPGMLSEREDVDRVLSLLQRSRGAPDVPPGSGFVPRAPKIHMEAGGRPGMRAISVNTRNSNLVYSDDAGTLDLTLQDGVKTLRARDPEGREIFAGPVTTDEDRKALPPELRERLEKLEQMQNVTFRTDGDFRGAEADVVRPRGIVFPRSAPLWESNRESRGMPTLL